MTDYTAAIIPTEKLKLMLKDNWKNYQGNIPLPRLEEINSENEIGTTIRADYQKADYVFIQMDATGIQATLRDTFRYVDLKANLVVHIHTAKSRQRLYDIQQEIQRCVFWKMHDITNNGYQLIRWGGFTELNQEESKIWRGQVRISFETTGCNKLVETP